MLAMLGRCLLNSVGTSNMPLDILLKINQAIASNSIKRVRQPGTGLNRLHSKVTIELWNFDIMSKLV